MAFREIDVTGNADVRRQMTERAQGRNTLPQIFIGSKHIGGCDELYALEDAGGHPAFPVTSISRKATPFAGQQLLGVMAVGAEFSCVDFDRSHNEPLSSRLS